MGIFDFLRKIVEKNKVNESQSENVSLSEIDNWINNKTKNIDDKNKDIFSLIQKRVSVLEQEIKDKIITAEKVDIRAKKSDERIKVLVEEGRIKYIELVKNILDDLTNLEEKELEKSVGEINRIFTDFNKKAHINYERATILIGKEMADIRDSLKSFSREVLNIFNENKDIASSLNTIRNVKLKLKQKEEHESNLSRIEEAISSLDNKIIKKSNESKEIISRIEEIEKSPEYLDKESKLKSLKLDLNKEFNELIALIDFKELARFHHTFEDRMEVINSYRNKFQLSFEKDNGNSIISLLDSANLNNEKISDKINKINKKKEDIAKLESEKRVDKIPELNFEKEKLLLEINELKRAKEKEEKRHDKANKNKDDIINEIRSELNKIGVELTIKNI